MDMSASHASTGVLISCHGTVENLDDVPAFLSNIRRGRPTPDPIIQEVRDRLEQVGGSPMMAITRAQGKALAERLELPVWVSGRMWKPYATEVLPQMAEAGIRRVLSLPLAPQSVHVYHGTVRPIAQELGMEVVEVPSWGLEPALIGAFASAIEEASAWLSPQQQNESALILSAHSLPKRVLAAGDPYETDFRAMADAVEAEVRRRGWSNARVVVAFQSQGMGGGDWLGPDLASTFETLRNDGIKSLVMAPIGFVADHVETLYDIDIEAAQLAKSMDFDGFVRMPPMNTRPDFVQALVNVSEQTLASKPS